MREVRRSVGEQVVVAEQTAEEEPEEHQMRAARVVHRRRVVRKVVHRRRVVRKVVHRRRVVRVVPKVHSQTSGLQVPRQVREVLPRVGQVQTQEVVRESFRVRMIRGRVVHSEVRQDFGVRELLQWKEAGLHVNRSFGSVRTDA